MQLPSFEKLNSIRKLEWKSPVGLLHAESWMKDVAVECRELIDEGALETCEEVSGWLLEKSRAQAGYIWEHTILDMGTLDEISIISLTSKAFQDDYSYFLVKLLPRDKKRIERSEKIPKQASVARIMAMRKYGGWQ
jgi:hypothetical protein